MQAAGLSASTIRNAIIPLRAIYRRLEERGDVVVNPTRGLSLPAVRGRREPRVSREHAAALVAAVPTQDRALWATAVYAGLRRGELAALRWEDVDLTDGVIRVERSYSFKTREVVEPKSHAGRRAVPITSKLRAVLAEHRLRTGRLTGLVLGRSAEQPFASESAVGRARTAWEAAGLSPTLGLHECRHVYASFSIAAGVNAKALSTYMGHASITITYDRYGRLMEGNEAQAAKLLDDYLDAAEGA
jgi:integrase